MGIFAHVGYINFKEVKLLLMMKGCQRKMIMMPTRDSSLFETAYFVLKDEAEARRPSKNEMHFEAMRILEENSLAKRPPAYSRRHLLFAFLYGAFSGALLLALVLLLRVL